MDISLFSMRKTPLKIFAATLFVGLIFLVGGVVVQAAQDPASDLETLKINCNLNPFYPGGSALECIPAAVYYIIYVPTGLALTGSAYIFDSMLALSMSKSYIEQPFVITGWTVVRDVANMLFIFILLYAGIMTMFGSDWKRPVLNVIIIALLINFSLFFTKVVIDTGNILATSVYTQLGPESTTAHSSTPDSKEIAVSEGLAKSFGPQSFMAAATKGDIWDAVFIFIVSGVVSLFVAFILLKAAFLLIGRLLMFWYLMIASPVAFISWALPQTSGYFDSWLKDLLKQSFFLVIFLFFIYMIMLVLSAPSIFPEATNQKFLDLVVVTVLKATLVIVALQKALHFAEKWAGDAGALGAKLGSAVMGIAGGGAAGLALGGVAMAGRSVGGKLANKAFGSGAMQRLAGSDNAIVRNFGMRGALALDTARTASWDVRGTKLGGKAIKATGLDMGKAGGKGGYVQGEKDWIKDQKKKAALMEVSEGERNTKAGELNPQYQAAKKNEEGQYQEERAAALLHTEATVRTANSPEGLRMAAATENVSVKKKAQMAMSVANSSKLEELKKKREEALLDGTREGIDKEIKATEKEAEDAGNILKNAEIELASAQKAQSETEGGLTLAKTTDNLSLAQQKLNATKKVIKDTEAAADKWKVVENARRREAYGQQVTPLHAPLSSKERLKLVGKIREGKTPEEKEEEHTDKAFARLLKKQKESHGGDEEEPEAEKKGGAKVADH